ncbi:MAG TPA: choice-of-anchor B family protein [Gemmatimonadales bacterium]|nr:choice-of-anchor B family protein [Gemmatimonadales bacterium]
MRKSSVACCSALILAGAAVCLPAAAQSPNFGRAIAATPNELLIGQPVNWYGPGTVYTYRRGADGTWMERSRLTAPDTARMDTFGQSIAMDGNVLAIGAPGKEEGRGRVYTFTRRDATAPWQPATPVTATPGGEFGQAVAVVGSQLVVGAPTAMGHGTVHVFQRAGSGFGASQMLVPSDTAGVAGFGAAISVSDEWMLIGAPGEASGTGAVYVAGRGEDGAWGTPTRIGVPGQLVGNRARLGSTVLMAGRTGYVGAPGAGMVVRLEWGDDAWRVAGVLQPFDGGRGTGYGSAIAMIGEELWVGAPTTNRGNGHVYRHLRGPSGEFDAMLRFTADSADGTAWPFQFGYSIAAAGAEAIVGMPFRDFGEGRVMAVARAGDTWRPRQLLAGEIAALGGGKVAPGRCQDGANGVYTCSNVEVVAHLPTSALGGARGAWVNDIWGWTDPSTQRDYALVARRDGISFVDVTDPAAPRVVGTLDRTDGSPPSVWRDIKVIGTHAYVVADGSGAHGVQVFDLTRLRGARGALTRFTPDTTYHEIFSAHNIVADTASRFLYVVGANSGGTTCGGGLHMIDATRPEQLRFAGCYHNPAGNARGYTHDAQCVIYRGPDAEHRGKQICIGSNESEINIADVTDKANPKVLGRNSYPNVVYAHQGWFDAEQRYFYMNDENDEASGAVTEGTRTIVWDLKDLDDPVVATMYHGPVNSSDHNLYIVGDRVFESNYGSGLRVLDISDRTNPREVAFFDSAPVNDDGPGHSATQSGAWSNYPFFRSGIIVFTSVREGLFIVKVTDPTPIS